MAKKTLDEFIKGAKTGWPSNAYVTYPGFRHLYVRHTQRVFLGNIASPVLDLANAEARHPGKGAFTKLIHYLRLAYPKYWLYAECVLNKRFEKKLLELGFIQLDVGLSPCFYMPPAEGEP